MADKAARGRHRRYALNTTLRVFAAFCLVCCRWMPSSAAQQDQQGAIEGSVQDSSGAPLIAARITAISARHMSGARTAQTDERGHYRLSALTPGAYELTVSAAGFRTVRYLALELLPGVERTLNARLEPAGIAEEVIVRAGEVTIDVRHSAASTIIDRQLLETLPFDPRRNDNGYPGFAPGINRGVAYGGTQRINAFAIDGTLGTDPTTSGVSTAPSSNWLEQVQVASLGAGAAQGEYTGALVNAITRSGGNHYGGLLEYARTVPQWTGNNRGGLPEDLALAFRPLELFERWTATAQAGGPVLRDRLWFFAGLDSYRNVQRTFAFSTLSRTPDEPRSTNTDPRAIVKMTGAPSGSVRLEGFVSGRWSRTVNGNAGPLVAPDALSTATFPEKMHNGQLTWVATPHALVEARYGRYWLDPVNGPTAPATVFGPPTRLDRFTGMRSGNVATFSDAWQQVSSAKASVTQDLRGMGSGSHQLRTGLEMQWVRANLTVGFPGGVSFRDNNGVPDVAILWAGATNRPTQIRGTLFAQDRWRLTPHVTVDPGVRLTVYRGAVPGPGTVYRNHSLSPRVGIAWELGTQRQAVVRAHYGRYHEAFVTSLYDFLDPLAQAPSVTARVIGPDQYQEIARSAPTNVRIAPDVKYGFVEELVGGFERDVGSRVSLGVQLIARRFRNVVGVLGASGSWTPVSIVDPGPDGRPETSDDGPMMTVYNNPRPQDTDRVLTNAVDARRAYNALQLVATRRRPGAWEFQASYTWSSTRGSFDNDYPCCGLLSAVGINGAYVNPNLALFRDGRAAFDRPHEVKVLGSYAWPHWGGVRIGGVYRYLSGAPWARTADFGPLTQAGGQIRVEPAGARTLPAFNTLDLRIEKQFRLSASRTVGAYADVFNVTNQGIPTAVNALSGPNFGLPTTWLDPRIIRAAVRVAF